jgi:hypothetical protein
VSDTPTPDPEPTPEPPDEPSHPPVPQSKVYDQDEEVGYIGVR